MPVISKSRTIRLRIEPDLFDRFSVECDAKNVTPSAAIRRLMVGFLDHAELKRQRALKDAEWEATLLSRRKAAHAAIAAQSPPVEPPMALVRAPITLSEKRRAEKLAKAARKARKEE